MPTTGKRSLYFHVPFCKKKCPYCHFYVTADKPDLKKILLDALKLEWEQKNLKDPVSIYFGGGTPSLFGPEAIATILSWTGSAEEVTIEMNPQETMSSYPGINRVSIGVQSLHDLTLKMLGRTHTAQQAIQAILDVHRAGIHNISIDLMYDIPGQTLESWKLTLGQLSQLPITHLSLYNLTIEPNTPYFRKQKELKPLLPPAETSLEMLNLAVETFEKIGLKRYEISAFAKPGFESVHNTGYWTGRPFLGLGPSAFSYWNGKRQRNVSDLKKYAALLQEGLSPIDFEEELSPLASLHERLAVALRLIRGVDIRDFPVSPTLYETLQAKGWLALDGHHARLTDQGLLFYDSVATEIVL